MLIVTVSIFGVLPLAPFYSWFSHVHKPEKENAVMESLFHP